MGLNEKNVDVYADTIVGPAKDYTLTGPAEQCGGPHFAESTTFSNRDEVYKNVKVWLVNRHYDAAAHSVPEPIPSLFTREDAFGQDGTLRIAITTNIGQHGYRQSFMEVAENGYYIYSSAEDMDAGNRETARFEHYFSDAVDIHIMMAELSLNRYEARQAVVNDFSRDERLERDRIKRQIKSFSKSSPDEDVPKKLVNSLKNTQKFLDDKRKEAYELPEYKALLMKGRLESIETLPKNLSADVLKAAASLSTNEEKQKVMDAYIKAYENMPSSESEQILSDLDALVAEKGLVFEPEFKCVSVNLNEKLDQEAMDFADAVASIPEEVGLETSQ